MYMTQAKFSDSDFRKFSDLIYKKCAIKLSPIKKTMLTSRLNRRLRVLGIKSFNEYYDFVTSPKGEEAELVFMINEVSTNKTDFFRENDHFDYIQSSVLPAYLHQSRLSNLKFNIWSAGCSSGEEPYTIAMVLENFKEKASSFIYSITATDISTKVLSIAEKGVYSDDRLVNVSANYRTKYMMRGKGEQAGKHRMVPELIRKIQFQRLNFLEERFKVANAPFDIIFCRNVIIYFDRATQVTLFRKFYQYLKPGGYFFIGHSETLPGMEREMERVVPAVYKDVARA